MSTRNYMNINGVFVDNPNYMMYGGVTMSLNFNDGRAISAPQIGFPLFVLASPGNFESRSSVPGTLQGRSIQIVDYSVLRQAFQRILSELTSKVTTGVNFVRNRKKDVVTFLTYIITKTIELIKTLRSILSTITQASLKFMYIHRLKICNVLLGALLLLSITSVGYLLISYGILLALKSVLACGLIARFAEYEVLQLISQAESGVIIGAILAIFSSSSLLVTEMAYCSMFSDGASKKSSSQTPRVRLPA